MIESPQTLSAEEKSERARDILLALTLAERVHVKNVLDHAEGASEDPTGAKQAAIAVALEAGGFRVIDAVREILEIFE